MKSKIYLVYDQRARVIDLDNCIVVFTTQDKQEAMDYAESNNGVVEECDFDEQKAKNGIIIN